MTLKQYAAKRHFGDTPEPAPESKRSTIVANYFCVQRHDASHLHYDFRLRVGDVLKSWAVPKGPTLDPSLKRLATQVEDHPVPYGAFEGNIPAGNYGAGSVMLWDRGTYDLLDDASAADQLARGELKFRLHGKKLKGDFAIVRMKRRGKRHGWLLIKKRQKSAVPEWDPEDYGYSVLSGRTQDEIARDQPAHNGRRKARGAKKRRAARKSPASRTASRR